MMIMVNCVNAASLSIYEEQNVLLTVNAAIENYLLELGF